MSTAQPTVLDVHSEVPTLGVVGSALQPATFAKPTILDQAPPPASTTIYRFRGYYVAGAAFEVWTSVNRNSYTPTGHQLVDVVVEAASNTSG